MLNIILIGAGIFAYQYLSRTSQAGQNLLFSVSGLRIHNIKSGIVNLTIPLEITNPSRIAIEVSEVFLVLIINNSQSLGSAAYPGTITIPGNQVVTVSVPVKIQLARVLSYAFNFIVTKVLDNLSVKGSFRTMGQTVPVKIEDLKAFMS